MTPSKSETSLVHKAEDCPLVSHRIACYECGYPECEALFHSVEDYLEIEQVAEDEFHDLMFDALGG